MANANKKLAVVIGAGSVKCAASLGMLSVLQREGIAVDLAVGCSAGSFYSAFVALGYSADEAKDITLKLWTRDITKQRNRKALLKVLFPKWLGFDERFGLTDDALILERLQAVYGKKTFADAQIPLYIAATDFHTGAQVVLDEGLLWQAMRASISIPFTFEPYSLGERVLIDGFMSDPLPINIAIREGADIILAMGFESPYQTRIGNAGRFAFQMSSIMTNNLLKAKFAFHNAVHHAELIPLIPEFKERIRLFDTAKIPMIIEEGKRITEAHLPYLKQLLAHEE